MSDPRTEQSARRFAAWFDPEMVVYALFGLLVVGLGARALAAWAATSWAAGERVLPAVVLASTVVALVSVLFLLRQRKRFLYLALALVAVGSVSFLLASAGLSLPQSWVE
jgi:uncharacterized membrane protein